MTIDRRVIEAARIVGERTEVAADVLLAVALVETRATAFVEIGGRPEPLIRFEGHYFDRELTETERTRARKEGLSHPRAGRIANPTSQTGRWALFDRACRISQEAAAASTSWGLRQVMGANAKPVGFQSAAALSRIARTSIEGQFEVGARFLLLGKLADRLMDGDLAGFARRYNGPGYKRNSYDRKIAAGLTRARAALVDPGNGAAFSVGARGAAVLRLQAALRSAGSALVVDGIFGPRTQAALTAWQKAAGLAATGFADDATRTALKV